MVDEARRFEEEDQRRRAEVETRNQADSLVYQSEKLLNDNADKVPEDLKTEAQGKIDALKAAVAANNLAEMQTAMTELNGVMQRLGEPCTARVPAPAPAQAQTDREGRGRRTAAPLKASSGRCSMPWADNPLLISPSQGRLRGG